MQVGEWEGRVGRKWAAEWRRTDRSFGGLTDELLARIRVLPFSKVLDVGCGAGELSLAVSRINSASEIIGVDISEDLLDAARSRAESHTNVVFESSNAAQWSHGAFAPDLIMSRHGVMFFEDPTAAFHHLAGLAAPNCRMVFSCFRDVAQNPWASEISDLLPAELSDPPQSMVPGPFAFADKDAVLDMLAQAGWQNAVMEPFDFAYIAGAGNDPVADALSYFLAIGPASRGAALLGPEQRAQFVGRLEDYLSKNRDGNLVALRAATWIVTANTPD